MKYLLVCGLLGILAFTTRFEIDSQQQFEDPRDGNLYAFVELDGLNWFTENLRFETEGSFCVSDSNEADCRQCGQFYPVKEALQVCPDGWRLPVEAEIKALLKAQRKQKTKLMDTLNIWLCGRVDYGKLAKIGEQNTFWLDAKFQEGSIMHWHSFGQEQELHDHNVVQAKRQFPVRCVCEIKKSNE